VFFRREKNKHNGASYLFSFTKEDLVKHIGKRTIQTGRLFFSSSLSISKELVVKFADFFSMLQEAFSRNYELETNKNTGVSTEP